jgi:hypothetical protein
LPLLLLAKQFLLPHLDVVGELGELLGFAGGRDEPPEREWLGSLVVRGGIAAPHRSIERRNPLL